MWDNFNEKIREIHEFVSKYTKIDEAAPQLNYDAQTMFQYLLEEQNKECDKVFPYNDEKKGRFIDLQRNFAEYQNLKLKKEEKPYADDYISYIENFERFDEIPAFSKRTHYKEYLEHLCDYLSNFFKNSKPLIDHEKMFIEMEEKFENDWKEGNLPGWEDELKKVRAESKGGDDKMLYCMPCKKIFTNEQSLFHHKKGKKHIKVVNKLSQNVASIPQAEFDSVKDDFKDEAKEMKLKEIAKLESKVIQLKGVLSDVIYNSANEARKKQSQTYQEIEAENLDIGVDQISSSDDEDTGTNVKTRKLPMGADGKPIPYWLYKLHGLGVEYKCEICGGASYWGRRAFDKHFQEWRHAYGMKCLKIPNTAHFKDVTEIAEALKLHQKIMQDNYNNSFKPDLEEEFEDENGNIFSRKKYIELKRKGAIK